MRYRLLLTGILSYLTATAIYAQILDVAKTNPKYSGHIHLDSSKDVIFEQFSPNTYALQLLQSRMKFTNKDLILGGLAELDVQRWHGNQVTTTPVENYKVGNGFYLTQATFDVMSNLNDWSTAFVSITDSYIGQGGPSSNYLFFPHAFILLGNLEKVPVYLTLGINNIPFGIFTGSGIWNMPLTSDYFNPFQAPQISLGFYKNGLNAVATGYEDQTNFQKHYAYSVYYNKVIKLFSYNVGLGYLTDLRTNDAGNPLNARRRRKTLPLDMGAIWDFNAGIGYGPVSLVGEYLHGSSKVGINRNNPAALAITLSYAPTILGKTTTFGLNNSKSINLNSVPTSLPGQDGVPLTTAGLMNDWSFSVSRPVFTKNFTFGLDAERSITYAKEATYTYTADFTAYL